MGKVKEAFSALRSDAVNWQNLPKGSDKTQLDPSRPCLADIFCKYFDSFDDCVSSAKLFYSTWNIYQPVRVVVSDLPEFMTDKKRALELYDNLDESPFWLR